MSTVYISTSNLKGKKYTAYFPDARRTVHFGALGYEDYTIHRDAERKERYLARHSARENWNDMYTAGFWSRWLLWNKPGLAESARDISRRFGLKIRMT